MAITLCAPYAAFNLYVQESILIFDACNEPAPLLPGSVWVDPARPQLPVAAAAAYDMAMNELTPDNQSRALVLCDSDPSRGRAMQEWLVQKGVTFVHVADRASLLCEYSFLFGRSVSELAAYPNEILPGSLFLGSKASANETAIRDLRLTHVLSLLDRDMAPPAQVVHKLCQCVDADYQDLHFVMLEALPFVADAVATGGRVLVHCDKGASRSASVVLAYLMHARGLDLAEALVTVQQQRSCVQPNASFLAQLRERRWELSLEIRGATATVPSDASDALPAAPIPPAPPMPHMEPFEVVIGSRKRVVSDETAPLATPELREVQIRSSWDGLLEPGATTRTRPLEGKAEQYASGERLYVIEGLFSPRECTRLVQAAEAVGFGRTSYPKAYRGNLRLITDDVSLAEAVWERLRPAVPATLNFEGSTYDAMGLNECWRLAKYRPGDRFGAHVDACFERTDGELSLFTVNVYMNDVPPSSGGATRFYPDSAADGSRMTLSDEPVLSVSPEAGLAVVFRQPPGERLLHDGERLASGLKYLFRSDVMYRRRPVM